MASESPPDVDQQPKSGDPDQMEAEGSDKVRAPIKLFEKRALTTTVVGAAVLATLRTLTRLGRSKSKAAPAKSGSSETDAVAAEPVGPPPGEASSENAHGRAAPADGAGQTDHLNQSLT